MGNKIKLKNLCNQLLYKINKNCNVLNTVLVYNVLAGINSVKLINQMRQNGLCDMMGLCRLVCL